MSDKITMKHPTAFFGQMWREAVPLGNGLTGALIYGGIHTEQVLLNRYDLWHREKKNDLPKVSDVFYKMRKRMDEGDYFNAQNMVCDALRGKGYHSEPGVPLPLGMLKIEISQDGIFRQYERSLYMDKGECEVSYLEGDNKVSRRCFVSRKDDVFVYRLDAETVKDYRISFGLHDDGTDNTAQIRQKLKEKCLIGYRHKYLFFTAYNKDKAYGAIVKVPGARAEAENLVVSGKTLTVLVKCFSECSSLTEKDMLAAVNQIEDSYECLLKRHVLLHKELYGSAELFITSDERMVFDTGGMWVMDQHKRSNESLLEAAYEDVAPAVLMEKLWKFGRYLFISGTCEEGLPFPLYGLWHGEYCSVWSQHVANENVQIIYWHVLAGNLKELMKPLIKYYCCPSRIEECREAAHKLFGCRGIFVSAYSSPMNGQPMPVVPVIIHYISVAGWLSKHFYEYYRMTRDIGMLKEYILPFMEETALFYEDYACYDETGKMEFYPSVSPENSPNNFVNNQSAVGMSHPMPVARNATMDLAILKELLQNLIALSQETEIEQESVVRWKKMLENIPEYGVNEDGAVKEWQHPEFEDNYFHRHLSHIYPLFPGREITKESSLYPAFEKAVELRALEGLSGWSLAHMSGIYASMGRGEDAIRCMDILCKGCLQRNLMTMHNDYRSMGVTLELGQFAPVQLDANMGAVNAIQMMLFQFDRDTLRFLPALPKRLKSGKVKGFTYFGGKVSFEWEDGGFEAVVMAHQDVSLKICLPENGLKYDTCLNGTRLAYERERKYVIKEGEILKIFSTNGGEHGNEH